MSERVTFGKTGLRISRVCFGTWQLSPRFWGEQSKDALIEAMRVAFSLGINFFDTADAYGDGYAETVLGEFASGIERDSIVLCTKVFNHFNPDASRYPDLSPAHVAERCEASLKRLRTDYIDLYLLHLFDPLTPFSDVAETLERLRRQGKIRHYGVSNHTVEQLRAERVFGAYNAVQPPYSLLAPDIEADLLPYCQAENIGVMVYSPLHKGLLTGKYTGGETFDDFRKFHPDFQGERFRSVTAAVRKLSPLAEKYAMSIYQLVLAATLMHPAIHAAVVGVKTPPQIAEAAAVMGKKIERVDYFSIRSTIASVNAPQRVMDAAGTRK